MLYSSSISVVSVSLWGDFRVAHMTEMDVQIGVFHDSVERATSKWKRMRVSRMPTPEQGKIRTPNLAILGHASKC
jgi:hypothetical protein